METIGAPSCCGLKLGSGFVTKYNGGGDGFASMNYGTLCITKKKPLVRDVRKFAKAIKAAGSGVWDKERVERIEVDGKINFLLAHIRVTRTLRY